MADVHAMPLTPVFVEAAQAWRSGDQAAIEVAKQRVLNQFQVNKKLHGFYNEMKLLDMEGNPIVSLMSIEDNEAGKSWFKAALANSSSTAKGAKCQDLYCSPIEFCGELGVPSVHMSHVVRDRETWEPIAMAVVDCNVDHILEMLETSVGLGESGQTYLVGSDNRMRSDSFLDPEGHSVTASFAGTVAANGVDTIATRKALAGESGSAIIDDYTGTPVLSVYAPLEVGESTWAVIAEKHEDEAFAAVHDIKWLTTLIAIVFTTLIVLFAIVISRSITKPIQWIISQLSSASEMIA